LTIGSDREDAAEFPFSGVNDIRIDARNRVYVLDRKESEIKIFDENGGFIRDIILKKGQGSGEFIRPSFFDLGENRFFIPYSIRKYDPEGALLREFSREMEIKKSYPEGTPGFPKQIFGPRP
jgi:hypothetical protein